jgi:hypothetical protein
LSPPRSIDVSKSFRNSFFVSIQACVLMYRSRSQIYELVCSRPLVGLGWSTGDLILDPMLPGFYQPTMLFWCGIVKGKPID